MSVLEERYRSLLRLLPASYREVWEEDMVATFLQAIATDDADEADFLADFGRPSLAEVVSVASLAARLRLGGVDAPPRTYAWGEAVRLVGLVGLLVNGVIGGAEIAMLLWAADRVPSLSGPPSALAAGPSPTLGDVVLTLGGVLWIGAYVALVLGHRRPANALAFLALIPFVVVVVWSTAAFAIGREPTTTPHLLSAWCVVLINTAAVAALAAFHRDAPAVARRPWLVAGVVGMAMVPLMATLTVAQSATLATLLDPPGLTCLAVVGAIVVSAGRGSTPSWSIALSLLAGGALVLRLVSLLDYGWHGVFGWGSAAITLALIQAVAVAGAGLWVGAVSSRALRGMTHPVEAGAAST